MAPPFKLPLKTVFLIDGLGAILSDLLLMGVVWTYHQHFGMPKDILLTLSTIILTFAAYSLSCAILLGNASQAFLKPIIIANLAYCVLTLGLIIYYWGSLTFLGVSYFVGEIFIISAIVWIEIKTLQAIRQQ